MARGLHRLAPRFVATVKEPGFHNDGGGLWLRIAENGRKSWVHKYSLHGKQKSSGLGAFPDVSLAAARQAAQKNREFAAQGIDPREAAKPPAEIPTLREAAGSCYESRKGRWTNPKHVQQWERTITRYVLDVKLPGHRLKMGERLVHEITPPEVIECLQVIWKAKPETARRTRQRLRKVFDWCRAYGHIKHDNPAGRCVDAALPSQRFQERHLRALPYRELPSAVDTIRSSRATVTVKNMVQFTILTASRNGEVRGARWCEMDLPARVWTIPAERMKMKKEHRVPLSHGAMRILEVMEEYRTCDTSLIFPGRNPTKPLSDMAGMKLLRDCGPAEKTTVHGFRSSFRDWCAETGKPREIAEAALAHTVKGVEGAYFRSDLFELRRDLMEEWSRFLTEPQPDNVLSGDFRKTA